MEVEVDPLEAVIDEQTDTIYTTNGSGTITVVNGTRCNAEVTSGCSKPLATITTGWGLVAGAINPATHTMYVANLNGSVFVIDVSKCNAVTTSGCGQPVKSVADSLGPAGIDVDVATDTVYAVNPGTGTGNTVSVINGATCNGTDTAGCSKPIPTVGVGRSPLLVAVDTSTDFIYVTDASSAGVSVVKGATCNAEVTQGCRQPAPEQAVGSIPFGLAVNQDSNTVYAVSSFNGSISIFEGSQ